MPNCLANIILTQRKQNPKSMEHVKQICTNVEEINKKEGLQYFSLIFSFILLISTKIRYMFYIFCIQVIYVIRYIVYSRIWRSKRSQIYFVFLQSPIDSSHFTSLKLTYFSIFVEGLKTMLQIHRKCLQTILSSFSCHIQLPAMVLRAPYGAKI